MYVGFQEVCTHLIMTLVRSLASSSETNLDHFFVNRKDTAATSNKDPIVIGGETRFEGPLPSAARHYSLKHYGKKYLALKSLIKKPLV